MKVMIKAMNPAALPPGYDYDVASEQVVLNRVAVKSGRIVLPDGMSYAALALPPHPTASLAVLRKLRELAEAGAILIGPGPDSSSGLPAWQKGDGEAKAVIKQMWGDGFQERAGEVRHRHRVAESLAPRAGFRGCRQLRDEYPFGLHSPAGGRDRDLFCGQPASNRAACRLPVPRERQTGRTVESGDRRNVERGAV
jgi:hypothetical protein